MESFKTICQGAMGAITFGAYHQFTTNKIMELNNEKMELQHKQDIQRIESLHRKEIEKYRKEMDELNDKYKYLETQLERLNRRWF